MRVAVNGLFLRRPNTGTGQYAINLLKEITAQSQHEIIALEPALGKKTAGNTEAGKDGNHQFRTISVPVPLGGNFGKLWFEQIGVPFAARRLKADILHVPYLGSPLFSPCPVVVTVHDLIMLILPEYRGSPAVRLYNKLVCKSARRADVVISDSNCTKLDIARLLQIAASRIRVVYLGCDESYWRRFDCSATTAVRRKYGLGERFILYIGGLDSRKNVGRLIEAFGMLKGEWELAIAGLPHSGNTMVYPAFDEAIRRSGVSSRINLLGFVPESDKPALYSAASLFVYPSLYEGFGLPPLEAMACGVPVVCSNASSLPEVVGNGGVLVDPLDCAQMARAMQNVLDDVRTAERLRELGRERATAFNWQRTASETLSIYNEVVSAARR